MPKSAKKVVIGTRKSALALWQTEFVAAELRNRHPELEVTICHIITSGDRSQEQGTPLPEIGGKGLFTAELEEALLKNEIDIAVHSLKDLPTKIDAQFTLSAICKRGAVGDVLVSRRVSFRDLPPGATVGTSSLRRSSQLIRLRADLVYKPIRGNVDTRISKVLDDGYQFDATILARAGLERLNKLFCGVQEFTDAEMLPAPGQGAMAVQTRANDSTVIKFVSVLDHADTRAEVEAERAFLAGLEAGCNTPVAARARVDESGEKLVFIGRCLAPDGSRVVEVVGSSSAKGAVAFWGQKMAEEALKQGAAAIISAK